MDTDKQCHRLIGGFLRILLFISLLVAVLTQELEIAHIPQELSVQPTKAPATAAPENEEPDPQSPPIFSTIVIRPPPAPPEGSGLPSDSSPSPPPIPPGISQSPPPMTPVISGPPSTSPQSPLPMPPVISGPPSSSPPLPLLLPPVISGPPSDSPALPPVISGPPSDSPALPPVISGPPSNSPQSPPPIPPEIPGPPSSSPQSPPPIPPEVPGPPSSSPQSPPPVPPEIPGPPSSSPQSPPVVPTAHAQLPLLPPLSGIAAPPPVSELTPPVQPPPVIPNILLVSSEKHAHTTLWPHLPTHPPNHLPPETGAAAPPLPPQDALPQPPSSFADESTESPETNYNLNVSIDLSSVSVHGGGNAFLILKRESVSPEPLSIPYFMGAPEARCGPEMSCENRCGRGATSRFYQLSTTEGNIMREIMENGTQYSCKCDRYCVLMKDCCPDYFSVCLSLYEDSDVVNFIVRAKDEAAADGINPEEQPLLWAASQYDQYGSCEEVPLIYNEVHEVHSIWIISRCPRSYSDEYGDAVVTQCENGAAKKLFSYPVSHRWFPGLIYKNVFCSICHGVHIQDIHFWNVVLYCSTGHRDSSDRWSFEDIVDASEMHEGCAKKQGAKLPNHVEYRTCKENRSIVQQRDYRTGCAQSEAHSEAAFPLNISTAERLACFTTLQPIWADRVSATFSSVHCAACSFSMNSFYYPFTCVEVRSEPGILQPGPEFAQVSYENGHIAYEVYDVKQFYSILCPGNVPDDPRTLLLNQCPRSSCSENNIVFSAHLSPWQMSCAVHKMLYRGDYWQDFPPRNFNGDLILTMVTQSQFVLHSLVVDLQHIDTAFREVLRSQCPYACPHRQHIFQRVSINHFGEFEAQYLHRGRLPQFFKILKAVEKRVIMFAGMLVTVHNYHYKSQVCGPEAGAAIELRDVPLVVHDFHIYAYVNLGKGCFFKLEEIGFWLLFHPKDGPPITAKFVVLCWRPEMAIMCKIPPPTESDDHPLFERPPCSPTETLDTNSSRAGDLSQEEILQSSFIPKGSSNTLASHGEIVMDETKQFKTVCYIVCTVSSLLSGIVKIALPGRNSVMKILFSMSKFSLAATMILYIINENESDCNEKTLAICLHFCWLLAAFSVSAALHHFSCSLLQTKTDNAPRKNNLKQTLKWAAGVTTLCLLIVVVCIIVDEESNGSKAIGYSTHPHHLLWMSKETGCYISFGGVIGVCYLAIVLELGHCGVRTLRMKPKAATENTNGGHRNVGTFHIATTTCNASERSCIIYFVHMISLILVAVVDYADSNPGLWPLMFSLAAFSTGLSMLVEICRDALKHFRHKCRGENSGNDLYPSVGRRNGLSETSIAQGYTNKAADFSEVTGDPDTSEETGEKTSDMYSPE